MKNYVIVMLSITFLFFMGCKPQKCYFHEIAFYLEHGESVINGEYSLVHTKDKNIILMQEDMHVDTLFIVDGGIYLYGDIRYFFHQDEYQTLLVSEANPSEIVVFRKRVCK